MTRGRARVHYDATHTGDRLRRALCGWLEVDVETDVSRVTCKVCLTHFASGRRDALERKPQPSDDGLQGVLEQILAPKAGPPPRLTPALWAASCRGAEHRMCGECEICLHEREMSRWSDPEVSAWNREHTLQKPEDAPRWRSLAAALRALCEVPPASLQSTLAGMIDRKESGEAAAFGFGSPRESPAIRKMLDAFPVYRALLKAYPVGGHARMTSAQCIRALLSRTVATPMPAYETLAAEHGVSEGDVRAVVKHGRAVVEKDLLARGLIPEPPNRRGVAESVTWRAEEVADG